MQAAGVAAAAARLKVAIKLYQDASRRSRRARVYSGNVASLDEARLQRMRRELLRAGRSYQEHAIAAGIPEPEQQDWSYHLQP